MIASYRRHTPHHLPAPTAKDELLIQQFVDGFLQGHAVLLATQHLRTEPLFDSLQLIAHKEGVVATAYLHDAPIRAIVRQASPYWPSLHQAMVDQKFYPMTHLESGNQYIYQYCDAPDGYMLCCTPAKELWRACWGRGFSLRSGIPLDLLVWGKIASQPQEQWHSLRGMECTQGELQAKVLGGSLTFAGTDWVVWAKQAHCTVEVQRQTPSSRPRPDLRGYYRLRH